MQIEVNEEKRTLLKEGKVREWNSWRMKSSLEELDLSYIDLAGVKLPKIDFRKCNLSFANFTGAILTDALFLKADLTSAILNNAFLNRADFQRANLFSAKLNGAILQQARFEYAKVKHAELNNAQMEYCRLNRTKLRTAQLNSTRLDAANFYLTELASTKLRNAVFDNTDITNVNLSVAMYLDETIHTGKSSIDKKTLMKSEGKIPDVFLKGCGFEDWEIETNRLYNPNLTAQQILEISKRAARLRHNSDKQFRKLFIASVPADERAANFIRQQFNKDDIESWQKDTNASAGPWENIFENAIKEFPIFLLILSKNSTKSDLIYDLTARALDLENKLNKNVICPIALDDSWKTAKWEGKLRRQIEKYNIIDFSKWEDPNFFETQYAKLLKGLDVYYLGI